MIESFLILPFKNSLPPRDSETEPCQKFNNKIISVLLSGNYSKLNPNLFFYCTRSSIYDVNKIP